jgi:hypothetical protein
METLPSLAIQTDLPSTNQKVITNKVVRIPVNYKVLFIVSGYTWGLFFILGSAYCIRAQQFNSDGELGKGINHTMIAAKYCFCPMFIFLGIWLFSINKLESK